MKKTLLLALALTSVSLAGCADEAADTDAVIVDQTAEPVTVPADDVMMDSTGMMVDTTGMMEGSTMDAAPMEGDAMMADTTTTM